MFIIGVGIAPQSAHKQPFCIVTNNSFKSLSGILAVLFLNGCAQTTSLVGPTYTMVKTGNIIQAGTSVATSYGVKHTLGKSPSGSACGAYSLTS